MTPFLVVFAVAVGVTMVATPLASRVAWRVDAVDRPTARKVHDRPTPLLGGLAMLAGFAAALGVGSQLDGLRDVFGTTSEPMGLLIGVLLIAALGIIDDLRGLSAPVKLAGQIIAAVPPILFGVQIVYVWVPGLDVVALSPDLGFPLTVLLIVAMVNAVNLIDGLDGLAAGVVAIAAAAFFAFAHASGGTGITESVPTSAPVVAAALTGICLGFLVFNFHPARIFMGDTGSMILGLLLASAGVSYVGRTTAPSYTDFAGSIPLLIPVLVLAVPFLDTLFAVLRRALSRRPLMQADRGHLHHVLIAFGHSHRRAVLVLYYWSAVMAFAAVGFSLLPTPVVGWVTAGAVAVGALVTAAGVRRARDETVPDADPVVRRRSG
ncbi:MAG: undecaprenyl/decaprenyl-phosphate alpha-N-acetylglucosaminyl 1-phosphate transferase [Actinobacteria bacterium]|nr:undecaprenyl/decaprenyl-phosphate alpha-N-acetylglucosaminyl 1-phosphate transferase [Actinomycetota bacterium]